MMRSEMNLDKRRVGHQFNKSAYVYDGLSGMQREIVDALLNKANLNQMLPMQGVNAPTVCDLGCGTGYALSKVVREVSPCNLIGLDLAPRMLQMAAERLANINSQTLNSQTLNFIGGDIEHLPLSESSVDLCLCSSALQWCDNRAAIAEIYRTLKPGGYALLSSFTSGTLGDWRKLWGGVNDQRFLSVSDFEAAAQASGLIVDELSSEQKVQPFFSFKAALASVRDLGAGNAGQSRRRGLMGASRLTHIIAKVNDIISQNGQIDLVYNVVYLVAHKPTVDQV